MTDYQRQIIRLHLRHRQHKQIARELGTTPDGVRSTLRKLARRGQLPQRVEWPVP